VDLRHACLRRAGGFSAAAYSRYWPRGPPAAPLPRTLVHPQGTARPCRHTGEAAAAPGESAVKPTPARARWPSPLGPEGLYEAQGGPAQGVPRRVNGGLDRQTLPALGSLLSGIVCGRTGPAPLSGLGAQLTVAGAQQAIRADFDESVRQDGLQETTDALFGTHRTVSRLRRGRGLVRQRDVAVRAPQDTVMAEGAAHDVRRELPKGCLATADRRTVHAPVLWPYVGLHQRPQARLWQVRVALGAEQDREGLHMAQEVVPGGQPPAIVSQAASRHDGMLMRMGAQGAGPRRQAAHPPTSAPDDPAIHRSGLYGRGCTPKQEGRERFWMAACQRAAGRRQGPGDHAGGHRHQQTVWLVQPDIGLHRLPLGTVPVLAGMLAVMRGLPVRTMLELAAKRLGAPLFNSLPTLQMPGPPAVAKLGPGRGAMPGKDGSACDQHRARMS
jgi:hypothetical protein